MHITAGMAHHDSIKHQLGWAQAQKYAKREVDAAFQKYMQEKIITQHISMKEIFQKPQGYIYVSKDMIMLAMQKDKHKCIYISAMDIAYMRTSQENF